MVTPQVPRIRVPGIRLPGLEIPAMTQYGLRVRSDVNIVAQFGRLDTTQANLAYYVNVGYHEDE